MAEEVIIFSKDSKRYRFTIRTILVRIDVIYFNIEYGYEVIEEIERRVVPVWYNPATWFGGKEWVRRNFPDWMQNPCAIGALFYLPSASDPYSLPISTQRSTGYFKESFHISGAGSPFVISDVPFISKVVVNYKDRAGTPNSISQTA